MSMVPVWVQPAKGSKFKAMVHKGEGMLADLQALVGGYIEPVQLPTLPVGGTELVMLVNEEGLLENLPHNEAASRAARRPIVGPAVYITDKDFNDEDED